MVVGSPLCPHLSQRSCLGAAQWKRGPVQVPCVGRVPGSHVHTGGACSSGRTAHRGGGVGAGELPRHSRSTWRVTVTLPPLLWGQVVPLVPLEGLGSQLGLGIMLPRKCRGSQRAETWGDPCGPSPPPLLTRDREKPPPGLEEERRQGPTWRACCPPRQRPGSHCERACGVGSPCCLRSVGAPGTVDPRTRPADGEMEAHGAQLVGAEPGPPDPVAACFSPLQMARWRSPSPSPGEGDTPAVRPWAGIRAGQACRGAPRGSERPVRLCGLCTTEFAPRFVPNPGPWCRPQRAHREDRDARVCPWVVTLSCPLGWLGHPLWLRRDLGENGRKFWGAKQ